jgi:hypothetical protein
MKLKIPVTESEMIDYLNRTGRWSIHTIMDPEGNEFILSYPSDIPLENFLVNKTQDQIKEWSLEKVFTNEIKHKLLRQ